VSKQALGALLLGCGALWLIVGHASRPAVGLGVVLAFMLYWLFRRR
jgi:uncharacterized protein (TIGR03382 family)